MTFAHRASSALKIKHTFPGSRALVLSRLVLSRLIATAWVHVSTMFSVYIMLFSYKVP